MDAAKLHELESVLDKTHRGLLSEIEVLKRRAGACGSAKNALAGIRRNWRDWLDPGKYGPTWFLVRDYELGRERQHFVRRSPNVRKCEPFFARELVDDLQAAEKGLASTYARPGEPAKPVPLGGLNEARTLPCPACGHEGLVVGCHQQTDDSPEGDAWLLQLFILCPDCPGLHDLGFAADEYRCLHGRPDPR